MKLQRTLTPISPKLQKNDVKNTKSDQQTGSFLAALACSSIATWLATSVLEPTKLTKLSDSWLIHAGSVTGAVIGFNLRRQSKTEEITTNLDPPIRVKLLTVPF